MVITQVLNLSRCAIQHGSLALTKVVDIVLIVLGAVMCLLTLFRFMKELLTMYNATKRVLMSRYMYLLAWEGLIYFLAYVPLSLESTSQCSVITNSILSYALTAMLLNLELVPIDGWSLMLLVPLHYIPTFTLVPRFILDLRKLYARDLRGRRGNIDTAFGFVSDIAVSTMAFADTLQEDEEEQVNEMQMEEMEEHIACPSSA